MSRICLGLILISFIFSPYLGSLQAADPPDVVCGKGKTAPKGEFAADIVNELAQMTCQQSLKGFAVGGEGGAANQLKFFDPDDPENSFVDKVIRFMAVSISTFAVLAICVGAYFLVIANGDQNQITKGKSILTYALIGVGVSFMAYFIIGLAISIFTAT